MFLDSLKCSGNELLHMNQNWNYSFLLSIIEYCRSLSTRNWHLFPPFLVTIQNCALRRVQTGRSYNMVVVVGKYSKSNSKVHYQVYF